MGKQIWISQRFIKKVQLHFSKKIHWPNFLIIVIPLRIFKLRVFAITPKPQRNHVCAKSNQLNYIIPLSLLHNNILFHFALTQ